MGGAVGGASRPRPTPGDLPPSDSSSEESSEEEDEEEVGGKE